MGAEKLTYIEDGKGHRISVILPIEQYHKMMERLEEYEAIKEYDKAKEGKQTFTPADQAFKEIGEKRKDIY